MNASYNHADFIGLNLETNKDKDIVVDLDSLTRKESREQTEVDIKPGESSKQTNTE